MTQRAIIREHACYLSEDFGVELGCRKFECTEDDLEQLVGRYSRGQRKGKLRGKLIWRKCIKGGWVSTEPGYGHGFVQRPNRTWDYHLVDAWTGEDIALPQTFRTHDQGIA